jgi:hypothetical protein
LSGLARGEGDPAPDRDDRPTLAERHS